MGRRRAEVAMAGTLSRSLHAERRGDERTAFLPQRVDHLLLAHAVVNKARVQRMQDAAERSADFRFILNSAEQVTTDER